MSTPGDDAEEEGCSTETEEEEEWKPDIEVTEYNRLELVDAEGYFRDDEPWEKSLNFFTKGDYRQKAIWIGVCDCYEEETRVTIDRESLNCWTKKRKADMIRNNPVVRTGGKADILAFGAGTAMGEQCRHNTTVAQNYSRRGPLVEKYIPLSKTGGGTAGDGSSSSASRPKDFGCPVVLPEEAPSHEAVSWETKDHTPLPASTISVTAAENQLTEVQPVTAEIEETFDGDLERVANLWRSRGSSRLSGLDKLGIAQRSILWGAITGIADQPTSMCNSRAMSKNEKDEDTRILKWTAEEKKAASTVVEGNNAPGPLYFVQANRQKEVPSLRSPGQESTP